MPFLCLIGQKHGNQKKQKLTRSTVWGDEIKEDLHGNSNRTALLLAGADILVARSRIVFALKTQSINL